MWHDPAAPQQGEGSLQPANPEAYSSVKGLFIKIKYFLLTTIRHREQSIKQTSHVGAVWEHLPQPIQYQQR